MNHIQRNEQYFTRLTRFIQQEYDLVAISVQPAKRGYYGETWRLDTINKSYFLKLDYFDRHKAKYQNSLAVVEYLCDSGIDFISRIVKTTKGELYVQFELAVLAVFEWIDGENIETDATKNPEYQMLGKIYPLTKPGFEIPIIEFSDDMAKIFYQKWEALKATEQSEDNIAILTLLEQSRGILKHRASRLVHFASLCKVDKSHFYITHGDAGGNFFVGKGRQYIVDWDEVMYAPPERDAWVMCCREWAVKLFNDVLKQNNIQYELRPKRFAFYCYHMFFLYLNEFFDDFVQLGKRKDIEEYFSDGYWIEERIKFADTL